jgi:hypothetical protein
VNFAFTSAASTPHGQRSAIIDSGATSHFCPDRAKFITFTAIKPQDVRTADGTCISAVGQGDVQIELPLGEARTTVTLRNMLYMPKMVLTLISTHHITAAGFAICKGTSVRFLTSPIISHSPPVHMYSPSPPLYYLQKSYLRPTTSRPDCPTTFQKSTHR